MDTRVHGRIDLAGTRRDQARTRLPSRDRCQRHRSLSLSQYVAAERATARAAMADVQLVDGGACEDGDSAPQVVRNADACRPAAKKGGSGGGGGDARRPAETTAGAAEGG